MLPADDRRRKEASGRGCVVLSPTPLSEGHRKSLREGAEGPVEFLDLSTLGRSGAKGAFEILRRHEARDVVLSGSPEELMVFRDILEIAARAIPAEARWFAPHGNTRRRLRRPASLAAASMGFSTLRSLVAVLRNSLVAGHRSNRRPDVARLGVGPHRCLYLRPTLMFGELVGGSVGHVAGVVNALHRHGHTITVVAMFRQPLVDPSVEQVIVAPRFHSAYPNELNRHRYHAQFFHEAERLAREWRPDFLYARYSLNDLTAVRLRRALNIPLVMEYNGSEVWVQEHWGQPLHFRAASERIERANLSEADLVVAVSEEIREQVLRLGIPPRRVLFYPNGVEPSVFDPSLFDENARRAIRRNLGVPVDADVFTFVGTFGHWHGTEVLAAAIQKLALERGELLREGRIHFLFVGDGPLAPRVREIVDGNAWGRCVTFTGYRPQSETPGILAASDVFVSPHVPNADGSAFFGSPTKLFEYMVMGCPIVASDLNQIGAVLRGRAPGEDGAAPPGSPLAILVEPGNVDSLVAGLVRAAGMGPEERLRLGNAARAAALRWFTWDRNVEAVLSRLEGLCGSGAPENDDA